MKFHDQNAPKTKSYVLCCDYTKEQNLILCPMTIVFYLARAKMSRVRSAYDKNYVISIDD